MALPGGWCRYVCFCILFTAHAVCFKNFGSFLLRFRCAAAHITEFLQNDGLAGKCPEVIKHRVKHPSEAGNGKKNGGFIPGIRPGRPTSDYLTMILNYIIFIGACGLTLIGILPFIFNGLFGASVSFGGTSLIIIVSVILETIKQIESQMLVRNYKGFLND